MCVWSKDVPDTSWQQVSAHEQMESSSGISVTIVATHAAAFARVLGVCSTFRCTQCKVDLGHV